MFSALGTQAKWLRQSVLLVSTCSKEVLNNCVVVISCTKCHALAFLLLQLTQNAKFCATRLLQNANVAAPKLLQNSFFPAPKIALILKLAGPPLKASNLSRSLYLSWKEGSHICMQ